MSIATGKNLTRNFTVMFMGNVLGQLFFFFALARLARVLGLAEFGAWNFAQVCMLYLFRASEFGLETVAIRETSKEPASTGMWIATVISLRFVLGTICFGVLVIVAAADLLPIGTSTLTLISSLTVFSMAFMLEWIFEAQQKAGLISVARTLKGVLFFLGVIMLVSASGDAEVAMYLYVGSLTIPVVIVAAIVFKLFGFEWSSLSMSRLMATLKKAGPIGIASMLSQYSMFASTMVVAYLLTNTELGYFTAAHRIVIFLWAYVILNLNRTLLPQLSTSFHQSHSEYRRFVLKTFRLAALVVVPIGLAGTLSSKEIITFLYSDRYEASGIVFGILLWGFVFATIRSILEIALVASDGQRQYLRGMVFLSILYTVLAPTLTLQFGIVGAACAVLVSEFSYFTFLILSCPFTKPEFLLKSSWKPLLAGIVALVSLIPFPELHFVFRVLISMVVFVGFVTGFKGVTVNDFELLRSTFRRDSIRPTI
ncbi:MAG TPA: oligosaccharide flippase family protein [Bacteroidota bacterium]|jgi:O-antigen/teichoic acid export membrane protein